ncbi:hypothetical protein QBC37DRAFT_391587 [Rhypophila decipiens]|uniref:Glycosyl transferase family 25 domain-containing protein n=1 Tax=Rhypophila decipiens TaxID=261697 RepID=A0AAN6XXZ8_9PEZI|nr:hypothetical protein QBC37DRAFT_391587 [Rhypophila decipiens]
MRKGSLKAVARMMGRPYRVAIICILFLLLTLNQLGYFLSPELHSLFPYQYVQTSRRAAAPEILNSTLGFEKVFVVNLPERTDRRDAMTLGTAVSNISVTWINGIMGSAVSSKVLPADSFDKTISRGNKGSWRAHMNALQTIIDQNLTSALIMEDDIDWDIRIKSQLQVFAQAARAFTQPAASESSNSARDSPKVPLAQAESFNPADATENTVVELPATRLPHKKLRPTSSPYGDDWDVLWLGHCGTEFPTKSKSEPKAKPKSPPPTRPNTGYTPKTNPEQVPLPLLRVTIPNDITVPQPQHLKPHPFALPDPLGEEYPPHTRIVHASSATICTQAYAVSQQGARKLLHQFGLLSLTAGWDLMLKDWCDGAYFDGYAYAQQQGKKRTRPPVCVTVQPPLFSHHYGKASASDIMSPGGGFLNRIGRGEMTPYIRYSVRLNMGKLVEGVRDLEGLVDQLPDN